MSTATTVLISGANRSLGLRFRLQYSEKGFNVYDTYRKDSAIEVKEVHFRAVELLPECHADSPLAAPEFEAKTLPLDLGDESSIHEAANAFGDQPLY